MLDTLPYAGYSPSKFLISYLKSTTSQPLKLKGVEEEWRTNDANAMANEDIVAPIKESDEKPLKTEDTTPRLRLKANLATDPAVLPQAAVINSTKADGITNGPSSNPAEYLNSLPSTLQSVLAKRFFLPSHLNVEAVGRPESAEVSRINNAPVYLCTPCGIRFSSVSTLEAHQTYYCSHRNNKPNSDAEETKSNATNEQSGNHSDLDECPTKAGRTGKRYSCTHCSYSADKQVSLNRHMRMHAVSPSPSNLLTTASNSDSISESQDRYCADCDIRFSSQKTFRAHKAHYCSSRHIPKPSATSVIVSAKPASSCTSGSASTSPVDTATCKTPPSPTANLSVQQPFLALPTNPILIVPYSVFRGASLLPGLLPNATGIPPPDTPCFLLPNGTLQPVSQAVPSSVTTSPSEVLKAVNKAKETVSSRDSVAPLDLSIKKPIELIKIDDHEKENIKLRTPTPEQIICAPSLHGSPSATPPSISEASPRQIASPKRKHDQDSSESNSPRSSRLTPKSTSELERTQLSPEGNNKASNASFGIPQIHPLLLRTGTISLLPPELQMRLAAGDIPSIPSSTPQVLVKQGVSKCKECNIVFCKHENYVVHKKHYCSARLQDEEITKMPISPPVSPGSASIVNTPGQYQQLICLACGIKFTSLDNLNAHQAYYCLKRPDIDVRRCAKCRGIADPGHHCLPSSAISGWRCPCCDVISATASAAQRHMETHTGVKAYRCIICRYKGNTLRGMRTHIRMHFDKRSPDLQEEKYITYILEDESANIIEASAASTGPANLINDRIISPTSEGRTETLHNCAQCPYSSVHKANILKHVKTVHISDEEHLSNGSIDKLKSMPNLELDEEIVIKKEAIEPEVIIAPIEETTKEEFIDRMVDTKPKLELDIEDDTVKSKFIHCDTYCKSCDISFNYYSTFVAHKKFYCSSHAGEVAGSNTNNNNNPTTRAAEASVL